VSLYVPSPGDMGTVGVIDCRVRHIVGNEMTLCERWSRYRLYRADDSSVRRSRLPICKWCQRVKDARTTGEKEGSTERIAPS
jgi:hypothetical protein